MKNLLTTNIGIARNHGLRVKIIASTPNAVSEATQRTGGIDYDCTELFPLDRPTEDFKTWLGY